MTASLSESSLHLRKRFGALLQQMREVIGLTQLDLAMKLDYAYPTTVSQIERGIASMPAANLREWAEILRQDVPTFARRFLYFNDPFVYEAMYGVCPFKAEGLAKPASPVLGRQRRTAPPRRLKTIEAGP